jgi:WAS family protein 1
MRQCRNREEAIESLEVLDQLMISTSSTLHNALASLSNRLDHLSSKLDRAQTLVQMLAQQPKRANTVYSANKYPANKTIKHTKLLVQPTHINSLYRPGEHELPGNLRILDHADLFVRLYESGTNTQNLHLNDQEGIGHLPENIDSVTNLLLFNSNQNPYKKYSSLDNLDGSRKVSPEQDQTEELFSAPQTIIDGSILVRF